MLRVVLSDRTERLADAMAEAVADVRSRLGPLQDIDVVVPNTAVRVYVQQSLAKRLGVAAHLRFRNPRAFLAEVLESTGGGRLAFADTLSALALEALHDEQLLDQPELEPVRSYLQAPTRRGTDLRRVQLARELGRSFEAYALHRPDWLAPSREPRPWQLALIHRLRTGGGPLDPTGEGPRRLLPCDLPRALASPGSARPCLWAMASEDPSPVLAEILHRLGATRELVAFLHSPSPEAWTQGRLPLQAPSWLEACARVSRGEAKMWGPAADWNIDLRFETGQESEPTPLSAFIEEVRDGSARPPQTWGVIQVLEAPGIRRECEAIADELWSRLASDPSLRLAEVGVVLGAARQDDYRAQLQAAFADAGHLPLHEIDAPLAEESAVVDACRLLLALPSSGRARPDLLRLLSHPTVRARFGFGDVERWHAWCERLAIHHGADRTDHEGTYIEEELYHWDQGLLRLGLAPALATPSIGCEPPIELGARRRFLPIEVSPEEQASAAHMVALARSLLADAAALEGARHTLAEWSVRLSLYLDTYVGTPRPDDERDRQRALDTVEALGSGSSGSVEMSFHTAAQLADDRLRRLRFHRGPLLAEGVTMASLSTLAPIPLRVVFFPGLGDGCFPLGRGRPSSLDLRTEDGSPQPFDLGPRDREMHELLLLLSNTSDAFVASYVARNLDSMDENAPAAALAEWVEHLRTRFGDEAVSVSPVPRARHEGRARSLAAEGERRAAKLGQALRRATGSSSLDELRRLLPSDEIQALERRFGIVRSEGSATLPERRARIRLSTLRLFLEEPVQGWAAQRLQLPDPDETLDPSARVDERFDAERGPSLHHLRQLFFAWAADRGTPEGLLELHGERSQQWELSGEHPTGVFGEAVRRRHRACLEGWRLRFLELSEGRAFDTWWLELGRSGGVDEARSGPRPLPALALPRAELIGASEVFIGPPGRERGDATLVQLFDRRPQQASQRARALLRSWSSHLVALASGVEQPAQRGLLASADDPTHDALPLPAMSATEAHALLERWVEDLLELEPKDRFPFDLQLKLHAARVTGKSRRQMEELLERSELGFGPLTALRLPPPSLDDALERLERRLGSFLRAWDRAP